MWIDSCYNKQFTTNLPMASLNSTTLAVLLLCDAIRCWHAHPSVEELEGHVPIAVRMLGNNEGSFARILRDLCFCSPQPVVQHIRAQLDLMRQVPAKRPHWRRLYVTKEKVRINKIAALSTAVYKRLGPGHLCCCTCFT